MGIQKHIDVSDSTWKKCTFDMSKISSMFSNGKTQRKYTSSHAQYASHAHQHNHAYIYGKVYTCTHCDRIGRLVRFCYAKLNMLNKNVWVRENVNPIRPKKIWVPKNTPNLIDVDVSSSKT